jgi:protoporphyrinogen/coproporphyrinogen III oxidase
MSKPMDKEVVIIGAGLTGLTLGFLLSQKNVSFVILEKDIRVGGVIHTVKRDGFIYETGPNTGIVAHPEVVELFDNLSPDTEIEIADPKAENRWILKNGKWNNLPSGILSGIITPLFSLYDKFRLLGEPFRKKGTNPMESVSELVKRRMGQSFLDYAVDPFISGIYAGDPEQLVTKYALPKLYALEQTYGSFIGGAIKKAREVKSERERKATRKVFSAKGGLQNLIDALCKRITPENIVLNTDEIKVSKTENGFATRWKDAAGTQMDVKSAKVITTVGAYALENLLDFAKSAEQEAVSSLKYAKVIQCVLGFRQWNGPALNAFGGLIPTKEKRKILGVLFPSSIFQGRTPEGGALLSVFLGGMKRQELYDLEDAEILKQVYAELQDLLKVDQADPVFVEIYRYKNAIPQYDSSSPQRISGIEKLQKKHPGLILAGNVRDGIGIADRIKQATEIAVSIVNQNH